MEHSEDAGSTSLSLLRMEACYDISNASLYQLLEDRSPAMIPSISKSKSVIIERLKVESCGTSAPCGHHDTAHDLSPELKDDLGSRVE